MERSRGKELKGIVLSNKMEKTAVVQVTRLIAHPVYKKILKRQKRYMVHDAQNQVKPGDKVQIRESSPISKNKRWRVTRVLERASS